MMVMQDDDGSMLGRQGSEGLIEQLSIADRAHLVPRLSRGRADREDPGDSAPFRPGFGVARMDDEPMEPGLEALGLPQRRQVTPRTQERLLRGVLGAVVITKDAKGQPIAPVDLGLDERREGVAIASARPFHEVDLHGASPRSGSPFGRFAEYGAGIPPNVQFAWAGRQPCRVASR